MQKNERALRLVGQQDGGEWMPVSQPPLEAQLRRFLKALLAPPLDRTQLCHADFREAAAPVRTVIPAQDIYLA
mgnify:CR=1 FL=1